MQREVVVSFSNFFSEVCRIVILHTHRPGLELYVDPFYATAGADGGHSATAAAAASEEKESHSQPRHPSSSSSGFNTRNIAQELSILSGILLLRQ